MAICSLDDQGRVEAKCPAAQALVLWRRDNARFLAEEGLNVSTIAHRYLRSPSLALQVQATTMLRYGLEQDPKVEPSLLHLASQSEPMLRLAAVRVASEARTRPALLKLVVDASRDESELLRKNAVVGMLRPIEVPTGVVRDRVVEILAKDPSERVRSMVCVLLETGDDATLLEAIRQVMVDPKTPPRLYGDCAGTLAISFADRSLSAPSRPAHDRFMTLLEKGPRDEAHPMSAAMMQVADSAGRQDGAWEARVAKFFVRKRFESALQTLAHDEKAGDNNRGGALTALIQLGVSPPEIGLPIDTMEMLIAKALPPPLD